MRRMDGGEESDVRDGERIEMTGKRGYDADRHGVDMSEHFAHWSRG